ncbi:coiled-coil domain-containing protein 186 isoform X2 [Rhodnius prolixus]|uniref:coiled-coil domain-containing protein 186 isoform X2 n=1 Tax=Rhodnius prolixus TaxID=13249 RepID=UPI003D18DE0C
MVQMALQEVVCNGIKTDNIQTNGVHNILPKYEKIRDGKETDGINIQEKSEVEDFKTDANHVATNKEQNTEVLVNNSEENKGKNDLAHLLDESIDVFSASFLTSDIIVNTAQGNDIKAEKVSALATKEQENLKEHDCLVHPTHLSLVNKLEASKNTISNLEDTIHRLEKQLSEESTKTEKIVQLETSIFQYEKEVQLCKQEHEIDQRTITTLQKEMEAKLLALKKQYETANKEKENMVMRYAVSEKELLDCKKDKDNMDKKMKEMLKENESSQFKLKTINGEKIKLAQQLDNKASELSNAYKEIDKLKEEINSRDIKIKWTQNKLISEMEAHKECPLIIERLNSNIKTLENEMDVCRKEINNLKLQLEQNNIIGSTTKEQGSRVFIENQENKTLHSEDQTLVKENSLISQQVENIKQILLGLYSSSNSLSDSASGLDFNISGKRESLIKQLKEIEHILSEVGLLSCDSENKYCTRHPNSSELLSLPNLKMSENEVQPHSIVLRHEDVKDLGNTGDNEVLMAHLKNRIEDLESQLAEEKLARENNEKNITRAEQILSEVDLLRSTNEELMTDILACKSREAELLAFTQKLTSKNVELQSEFSAVESKADELEKIEKSHAASELQRKSEIEQLHRNLAEEKERRLEDTRLLARQVAEKTTKMENLLETVNTLQSELSLVKNKHVVQIKELQRELSQYKRKIEQLELLTGGTGSSTNSVTSGSKSTTSSLSSLNDSPVLQGIDVPAQILVERIVKLQQESAKQNDRIEFLEEHTAQLVKELQKKSRLLQNYILREQAGTLTSNSMDRSKAELSKSGGIMASLYGNKPADETMTFELCLEINRKLQAVLEDTLLKNITLKENIDTLGDEIARLSQQK